MRWYPIEDATSGSGIEEGHGSTENTPHHALEILLCCKKSHKFNQQ